MATANKTFTYGDSQVFKNKIQFDLNDNRAFHALEWITFIELNRHKNLVVRD